jgi:hypothetical protein
MDGQNESHVAMGQITLGDYLKNWVKWIWNEANFQRIEWKRPEDSSVVRFSSISQLFDFLCH